MDKISPTDTELLRYVRPLCYAGSNSRERKSSSKYTDIIDFFLVLSTPHYNFILHAYILRHPPPLSRPPRRKLCFYISRRVLWPSLIGSLDWRKNSQLMWATRLGCIPSGPPPLVGRPSNAWNLGCVNALCPVLRTLANPTLRWASLRVSVSIQNLVSCSSPSYTQHGGTKTPSLPSLHKHLQDHIFVISPGCHTAWPYGPRLSGIF